jgi:tRNA A37 N6-isopentenylltransferase MiaA
VNQTEDRNRIVELTREIAGAQGLAALLRQVWKDADEEHRKKLSNEMILALATDHYMLREALSPLVKEMWEDGRLDEVKETMRAEIEAQMPKLTAQVAEETKGKLLEAARLAMADALRRVIDGRRW